MTTELEKTIMTLRKPLLAGNWKMNKTNRELPDFFETFAQELKLDRDRTVLDRVDVMFAVPFTLLVRTRELASPMGIQVAAQNVHWEDAGAYTGEISVPMLVDLNVGATLIGHSERRQYFNETDATAAKKTRNVLAKGLLPIVCVGETLEEREAGSTHDVVRRQVHVVLEAIDEPKDLVIAYEPVWAIGTGRSATSAQAQEVHALIREVFGERFGGGAAARLRILYGGSAKPDNIEDLMAQPDIDGGLVGGASLKPADFAAMVASLC